MKSLDAFEKLGRRERQIIVYSLTGTDDKEIAKAFKTTKPTIEKVRAKAVRKWAALIDNNKEESHGKNA